MNKIESWDQIKEIFSASLDVPVAERERFVSERCSGDEDVFREVMALIAANRDDSFLERSAVLDASDIYSDDAKGRSDKRTADQSGRIIRDRYRIERLLGRGGMGEVYLAEDLKITRKVALKLLHPDRIASRESLKRFANEAKAVSGLNHPNIVTIYEFDHAEDGSLFISAEYVKGRTLNDEIANGIDPARAIEIALQTSSALVAAHSEGIIHRDIKPENIMIRPDGFIKVLDFGLAKLSAISNNIPQANSAELRRDKNDTRPGLVMGTAAYMSPEQARGMHVDERTDIWALGVVIFEMLTGRRPFNGDTTADILVSVLTKEPEPLVSIFQEVPPDLIRLVEKALRKDASERYRSAVEMRSELEEIGRTLLASGGPIVSRSAGLISDGTQTKAIPTAEPRSQTAQPDGETRFAHGGETDPSGEVRTDEATPVTRTSWKWPLAAAAILIASVSFGLFYFGSYATAKKPFASAAVLPFETAENDAESLALANGLSDGLIDRLARLPDLKVIARRSSIRFKNSNLSLREIGNELGARVITTGSVLSEGDEIIVRIDITDVAENRQLAGKEFRRKRSDVAGIQNEIAESAIAAIAPGSGRASWPDHSATANSDAFRAYLNGLVELNGGSDVRSRALEYFQRAVEIDPDYADAYAEIGWIYWARANANEDPRSLLPNARLAIDRALSIDPEHPKAHVVRAMIREYDLDWSAAESDYRTAIDMSPNMDFARNNYGFFLSTMGRGDEALAQLDEAAERDPMSRRMSLLQRGIVLVQERRFADAIAAYEHAAALDPVRPIPQFAVGYALHGQGSLQAATERYRAAIETLGGEQKYTQPLIYLAAIYAKNEQTRGRAVEILSRLRSGNEYVSPALIAVIETALGEHDDALNSLDRAYRERDPQLRYIGVAFEYDPLRREERFAELLRKMGLSAAVK